jgi:16S rRNA (cytosine967-C5)-methyltransferase
MESTPSTVLTRFSDDVKEKAIESFGDESEKVLQSLVEPVHTYYIRCNTHKIPPAGLVSLLQRRELAVVQNSTVNEALGIIVEGPLDIARTEQNVMVDKKTAESVLQGANVYAPGIVNIGSMRFGDEVTIISELGEVIATGKAEMNATDLLTFRKGLAISVTNRRFRSPQVRELEEFRGGLIYPQSLAAMVTARVLNPKPGETIVDMNCAPGGKISHISQLMKNKGKIYGFDRNARKIRQTRETISRLGCENVILSIHDSRYLPEDFSQLEPDRVLIDPPCSALGLRPKVYDFTTQERIENLAAYQRQFIKAASRIVKPGGTIVYSVCTFTIEECERITEFAIQECDLHLIPQEPLLGSHGLRENKGGALCQRFHPHTHEIGYFIAKFER